LYPSYFSLAAIVARVELSDPLESSVNLRFFSYFIIDYNLHIVNTLFYPFHSIPAGHDALASFVDVAVQQPQLPVPSQKDDKSASSQSTPQSQPPPPMQVQVSQAPPPPAAHHDIRYRDPMAAIHHQQMAAAVHQQFAAQQYRLNLQHIEQAKRDQRQQNIERDRELIQNQERMQHRIDRQREHERQRRDQERREQERVADERDSRRMERIMANAVPPPVHGHALAHGHGHYMRGPVPETGPPRTIPDRDRDA